MLLKSYEIQLFQAGAWKINAIFDDEELALFEARRLAQRRAHAGIRVVAEEYDQVTGEGRSRTIYRDTKTDESNAETLGRQREVRQKAMAQRQQREAKKTRVRTANKQHRRKKQKKRQDLKILLLLFLLVAGALGLMIGLRYLENFL